jgi:hypothetical protein
MKDPPTAFRVIKGRDKQGRDIIYEEGIIQ